MTRTKPTQADKAYSFARKLSGQPRAAINKLLFARFSRTLSECDCEIITAAVKQETEQ